MIRKKRCVDLHSLAESALMGPETSSHRLVDYGDGEICRRIPGRKLTALNDSNLQGPEIVRQNRKKLNTLRLCRLVRRGACGHVERAAQRSVNCYPPC